MTVTSPARPRAATLLRLAALAAGILLVFASGRAHDARAIETPEVFSVTQSPLGPTTVVPANIVTYTIAFQANQSAGVSNLILEGNLGSSLTISGFSGGLGPTHCTGAGTSSYTCTLGGLGPNSSIAPITVSATVGNVANGTVIDRPTTAFFAKDGPADAGVNPPSDDAAALTVQNENITVTTTPSPTSVFEAGLVEYTISFNNTGAGASGNMVATLTLTNGTVTNVVCPGGGPGTGSGTSTGSCPAVAVSASTIVTGMTVTVKAHNSGNSTLSGALTLTPAAGNNTGSPAGILYTAPAPASVTIIEAAITGPTARDVGQTATICTANAPTLNGHFSGSTTYTADDFETVATGGATVSGKAIAGAGCPGGQQGVVFTSTTAGTVTVTLLTRAPGTNPAEFGQSNSIAVVFGGGATPNPAPALSNIAPIAATAGAAQFVLTVTGTNFISSSVVRWNGESLDTTYIGATSLTAIVPAARIQNPGSATVTVFNPAPGGGTSAGLTFTINPAATKLAFTTQPGNGVANQNLATQPVVAVQTAGNATVTTDNTTQVTLAISDGATLTCDGGLTRTVTAGIATYAGCKVTPAGANYTLTATSSPALTPATSASFEVTAAPPTTSNQLVVQAPASGAVARSRLTFRVATGTLAPTEVRFIIRRTSDNHYWNASTGAWQAGSVLNVAANAGGGTFALAVTGDDRRDFVNTSVTVEVRAIAGATTYVNSTIPTLPIR